MNLDKVKAKINELERMSAALNWIKRHGPEFMSDSPTAYRVVVQFHYATGLPGCVEAQELFSEQMRSVIDITRGMVIGNAQKEVARLRREIAEEMLEVLRQNKGEADEDDGKGSNEQDGR